MQLIVHAPFGGRINRGLGLALRKRFCRRFDFELQAAANDDAVVLSLGPQHTIPLAEIPRFLSPRTAEDTLAQALLASPLFPPLAACQENAAAGPIETPDHPMVRQTIHDCLHEATDVDGLVALLQGVDSGAVRTHFRESAEPSPLCHEVLNGRPYTFLDDAPLEERRTRAVALRRGLPETVRDLGRLDPEAIARVREEARPDPRDAEELHDALLGLVALRPKPEWTAWFDALVRDGRAACVMTDGGPLWLATEGLRLLEALFP